jgi:hypothetical protein
MIIKKKKQEISMQNTKSTRIQSQQEGKIMSDIGEYEVRVNNRNGWEFIAKNITYLEATKIRRKLKKEMRKNFNQYQSALICISLVGGFYGAIFTYVFTDIEQEKFDLLEQGKLGEYAVKVNNGNDWGGNDWEIIEKNITYLEAIKIKRKLKKEMRRDFEQYQSAVICVGPVDGFYGAIFGDVFTDTEKEMYRRVKQEKANE